MRGCCRLLQGSASVVNAVFVLQPRHASPTPQSLPAARRSRPMRTLLRCAAASLSKQLVQRRFAFDHTDLNREGPALKRSQRLEETVFAMVLPPCENRTSFFEFSLCLSRACLG